MAAGRFNFGTGTLVEAPEFADAQGGLLDRAEIRDVRADDPALRGYMFPSEAGSVALGVVTGFANISTAQMTEGAGTATYTSLDPFTVYGAFEQSTPGATPEEAKAAARERLDLGESRAIELGYWQAGGVLPTKATVLRSGTALKAELGLGLIAEEFARLANGMPYFHAGRRVALKIAGAQLVDTDAEEAAVKGGGVLVNGAGYYGKTTIGTVTPTADQAWLFATGKPLLYRSDVMVTEATGQAVNREAAFALRTYVPAVDAAVIAVLIDLTL